MSYPGHPFYPQLNFFNFPYIFCHLIKCLTVISEEFFNSTLKGISVEYLRHGGQVNIMTGLSTRESEFTSESCVTAILHSFHSLLLHWLPILCSPTCCDNDFIVSFVLGFNWTKNSTKPTKTESSILWTRQESYVMDKRVRSSRIVRIRFCPRELGTLKRRHLQVNHDAVAVRL
jgi:hypothetical protein